MTKGVVYYTHNKCMRYILETCREQIDRCLEGMPLVSVSQEPLDYHTNIVLPVKDLPRDLAMFKQQLAGLEAINTDVVFFCEHDVLYHPSHFEFTPTEDAYFFNLNVYAVDETTGQAMHYDKMRMTSGLVAFKDILVEHYKKKIEWVEQEEKFSRREMGYEPGKSISRKRIGNYKQKHFWSSYPNIDIKHDKNITRKRFNLEDFRNRKQIEDSWILTDDVPYWGVTVPFSEFIERTYDN